MSKNGLRMVVHLNFDITHLSDLSILAHYHTDILEAATACPGELEDEMGPGLLYFWNLTFATMIITAILGNVAVLYIVVSKELSNICRDNI